MRHEILLNSGWCFHKGDIEVPTPAVKGPVYSQSKTERKQSGPAAKNYQDGADTFCHPSGLLSHEAWSNVDLPHDYVVAQDLDSSENNALGYLKYENAWYRKHFTLPEGSEGKRVTVRFDGIAGKSTVYLNGCLMYHNYSSYNTFEVDISDIVRYDEENVLAVYVNTEEFEGWWYQGGGIYRNVYLTVTEPVAVDLWGVYCPYKKLDGNNWQIDFEVTVLNTDYEPCTVTAESRLYSEDGCCALSARGTGSIEQRDKAVLKYSAVVSDPLLWDCENPNLYTVKTVLFKDGEAIDEVKTRIGFRTVELSKNGGLLLNGKKTVIKGVCAHQDFGLTGLAVPDNIAKYKVSLIKEMGANGYRTSHYQQTEAYMDAFDEMGFLVMDEARWFESTRESLEQLESLVKRDRNRPSVIFWSTSNEEPNHTTDIGRRLHRALAEHIRKLDRTRFITAAEDRTPESSTIYDYCDAVGINYNLGIYDEVHTARPEKALFASECCATATTRDWNFPSNNAAGRVRDKDTDVNNWFLGREKTWKFLMERDYVLGAYQWAAVEHRGEALWPAICSKSGALDLFLQKKGAFYQNKSHWTDEPMVHIVPHWNFAGLEGTEITVTVYTNCEQLKLYLNGEPLGERNIEKYGHGEWGVKYTPGELKAVGFIGGKAVCEDIRKSTGRPVGLRLTLDNEFKANGNDMALFTCECVDSAGNTVPDVCEFVKFFTEAPAKIIGTGSDNCDHTNVALPERQMYMGKIRIAVKPARGQKRLTLLAESAGCGLAQVVCECEERRE